MNKIMLQQHLPLAVLKRVRNNTDKAYLCSVATAPTACGIETLHKEDLPEIIFWLQQHLPLAVLKLLGGV